MRRLAVVVVFVFAFAIDARADITLPRMLASHMVMQRGVEVPVWGKAGANHAITLKLDGTVIATGKSNDDGVWKLKLPATGSGGPHAIAIDEEGGKGAELADVLFGEVWICSGQSNMEMPVRNCQGTHQDVLAADHPGIRLLLVPHTAIGTPQEDVAADWNTCTPDTAKNFSAAAYFFGVELNAKLNVPIGLIDTSWGATSGEPWASRKGLETEPDFKGALRSGDDITRDFESGKAKLRFEQQLKEWNEAADRARAAHEPEPKNKPYYDDFRKNPSRPANLFNGMIAPFTQMPVAGTIWYQGESNVGRGAEYRVLFPLLIRSWRQAWSRDDLPFYFVQIAPYHYKNPDGLATAELWESQLLTMKNVPHTGMAVINDVGNLNDIHPDDKKTVGHRLALWALSQTYGENLVYSGPIYRSMKVEGDKIRLSFDHVHGGLISRDGQPLTWFTFASKDLKFVPAQATIDGDTIVLHADGVTDAAAVRFAWNEAAVPNLMNKEGLPAAPFRTDDAPMVTAGKLY